MRWYLIEYTKGKEKFADVRQDAGGGCFYQIAKEVPIENAFLIQSAPEMLEILEQVHCDCSTMYPCDPSCFMPQVEKLIKKAKGES